MMVKLEMISGLFQAILLHVPRDIDLTRAGENIDDWNVDGHRELSDTWTSFTRFTFLNENHRMDVQGPGGD